MSRTRIVQKFGGTSLASIDRITAAASRAVAARREGADVVLVVSAMAGETDRLLDLAKRVSRRGSLRELDAIAATGEQVSAALMALALESMGASARSLLGHQLPIKTDATFGDAQIASVGIEPILAAFDAGAIPVVAGFQGSDDCGNVTTLGRGGSDTTAVAVAAALEAACEIYTDVDGVYSIDPRLSDRCMRLSFVGYRTMHALAAAGAKVLERRSVALAMDGRVPLYVRSSLEDGGGTLIGDDRDERARDVLGIAVALGTPEARCAEVSALGPGAVSLPSGAGRLARAGVSLFAEREVPQGRTFVVPRDEAELAAQTLHDFFVGAERPSLKAIRVHRRRDLDGASPDRP